MIEAAWLLVAIELNGALISKGALASLNADRCAVEMRVMAPLVAHKNKRRGLVNWQAIEKPNDPAADGPSDAWITDARHCSLDAAEGVLRMHLPRDMLAEKTLPLAEPSGAMGIALLHDPTSLSRHADYSAQPLPQAIPSLAIDSFVGSDLNGLGLVAARGPLSASVLYQQPSQGRSSTRATAEIFLEHGGQLRLGDLRAERGPEQVFGEYRGLHYSSRAQALKSDGKAEAMLSVQNPSRVQFLDRNGIAIYSTEMLAPGNYRVQGYAASATPGFLSAQIIDINGSVQTVTLPWTADRRLLLENDSEWELLAGYPRALVLGLTSPPVLAAKAKHGLTPQLTLGAYAEHAGDQHRIAIEASSGALDGLLGGLHRDSRDRSPGGWLSGTLATISLGRSCNDRICNPTLLGELRASVWRQWHAALSMQQSAALARTALFSLNGQLNSALTGSLQLAHRDAPAATLSAPTSRQVATIAANLRIAPTASIQLQARHHLLDGDASGWSGYLGLTMHFAKARTTVSGQLAFAAQGADSSPRLGMQAAYGAGALYGSSFSVAHMHEAKPRSDLYARHASPYGDVSLRADTISDRAAWSASTRLWLTSHGARLAPTGEDNLVIQNIGAPDIRLNHAGRDMQVSDTEGFAVFRKAPSWTDAIYAIDPRSIPFGAQLSASRIRVPLAANRAYVIDMRHLWSQSRSWRIAGFDAIRATGIVASLDRHGKKVFISDDGYADLQSIEQLPIAIATTKSQGLYCEIRPQAEAQALASQDILLHCAPHLAL